MALLTPEQKQQALNELLEVLSANNVNTSLLKADLRTLINDYDSVLDSLAADIAAAVAEPLRTTVAGSAEQLQAFKAVVKFKESFI